MLLVPYVNRVTANGRFRNGNVVWDAMTMTPSDAPVLSTRVEEVDWIRDRLRPWSEHVATSVIPDGFEAYARILHPAQVPSEGRDLVRWKDVSQWSDVPMSRNVQWHEIALPRLPRTVRPPWWGQGPAEGDPYRDDLLSLVDVLTPRTDAPQRSYFCVWDGHFQTNAVRYGSGMPSVAVPRPDPPPRLVELPNRSYGLFEGALNGVTSIDIAHRRSSQPPNLWWPNDRSWIVASEIDLPWTYVGGSKALIESVLADPNLESETVEPGDSYALVVTGWLGELVDNATIELLESDSATLELSLGTVQMSWRRLGSRRKGTLVTSSVGPNGTSSTETPFRTRDAAHRRLVTYLRVRGAVLGLIR